MDQGRSASRISPGYLAAQLKPSVHPLWSIGIVVPAQNEEASIEPCIQSIRRSCETAQLRDYWIVIVADSCTDDTLPRASRAVAGVGEVLECDAKSAGSARRLGVDAALAHFNGKELGQIWLANTDADTLVPHDWITVQLKLADAGIAAVAGIVKLDEGGSLAALELEHYPGMVEEEVARAMGEAEARWPLLGAIAIHRYGRIAPGERIVFVAVATVHCGAAFAAAEMLMDYLKTRAPFWKGAIGSDGAVQGWIESKGEDDRLAARWSVAATRSCRCSSIGRTAGPSSRSVWPRARSSTTSARPARIATGKEIRAAS